MSSELGERTAGRLGLSSTLAALNAQRGAQLLEDQREMSREAWRDGFFTCLKLIGCALAGMNPRILIGTVGYKGPPVDGTIEVGYGIVAEHQRRGYANEATQGLIDFAFSHLNVNRLIAETYPELVASIGVMTKCGMRFLGEG